MVAFAYPDDGQHVHDLERYVRAVEVVELDQPVMGTHSRLYWQLNGWRRALLDPNPLRGQFADNGRMKASVDRLMKQQSFDIVQIHQAYLASLLPVGPHASILDLHDVLSDYEQRLMLGTTKPTHRLQAWAEWKKMQALERRVVPRFDACTTVSEHDRASLLALTHHPRVEVVPNGVDTEYFQPTRLPEAARLIYSGSMSFPPNSDAVRWFHSAIWPSICRQIPNACLDVVGIAPPQDILAMGQDPGVTVTGYVEDVRPYFQRAAVAVVPLRLGSGTRLKILDAWAMGKAVVSTSVGAEGLAAVHGQNILIADTPDDFARCVVQLLGDSALQQRLGSAGRQTVEAQYSWAAISCRMDALYGTLQSSLKEGH